MHTRPAFPENNRLNRDFFSRVAALIIFFSARALSASDRKKIMSSKDNSSSSAFEIHYRELCKETYFQTCSRLSFEFAITKFLNV